MKHLVAVSPSAALAAAALLSLAALAAPVAHAAAPERDALLARLATSPPMSLSEDDLRKVGTNEAPRDAHIDYLLNRLELRYDAEGRAHTLRHLVLRYRTREAVEASGTFDVPFSPWFEDRPIVRGRVVPARGVGADIDPRTIAEAAAKNPELIVSDRKNLAVPLPHLAPGATVELVIEHNDHRSPYGAPVRNGFQARGEPSARATLVVVEAPAALGVTLQALDTEATITSKEADGKVVARAEIWGAGTRLSDGKPHGLMWGVGRKAGGWELLAQRYSATLAPVLAVPTGWPAATGTRKDKIGQVIDRLGKELRYTGLHLGDAAIVPFSPKDTLARGYGDCKDLATLVVRALGEAGIPASVVLLRAGDSLMVDPQLPGLDLFDHAIVYVPAGADPIAEPALWIDATAPEFGVGALPSADLERQVLVVDATATPRSLTPTPARDAAGQASVLHLDVELRPEPIGPGTATMRYTFGGDERYNAKRLYGQDKEQLDEIERGIERTMGGQVARVTYDGLDDARGPITATYELVDVRRLDSDGRKHKLDLDMEALSKRLDPLLARADRRFPFKLPRALDYRISYRVVPPAGYRVAELPKAVDVALGPVRWKVDFTDRGGVVEAVGRYEVPQMDLAPAEVGALLEHRSDRDEADDFPLELVPEQAKLAPLERAAWFRKELAQRPKDAELRARWALELDKWGLSDEARREVDQAAKDVGAAPSGASAHAARFVLVARARLWERDTFGRVYQPGWDRKRAIAAWRAVLGLVPKSVWARHELADILVRDERGELKRKRDKDGDEGRALLEATADEGSDAGAGNLLEALDAIGAWPDIIRFAEHWKGAHLPSVDNHWAKAVALVEGPAAAAALIASWSEPNRMQTGIQSVTAAYMMSRRFADASAVFDALSSVLGGAANPLAEWSTKVKKLPPMNDFTTPEKALQSFYSMLAEGPPDLDKRLSKLFGHAIDADEAAEVRRGFEEGRGLGAMVGGRSEGAWALYDLVFGLSTLKLEGDDKTGWQVSVMMSQLGRPDAEPVEFGRAYFTKDTGATGGLRLVGFTGAGGIPLEAAARLARGDVEGARKWLGWAWNGAARRPKTLDAPEATTPNETMWRTALLLSAVSVGTDPDELMTAFQAGGKHLVGDERGLVLEVLSHRAATPEQQKKLLALMDAAFAERAPSSNERAVRARVLALVGDKEGALKVEAERLASDPDDADLISEMANIESLVGEVTKARERLAALRDTGRLSDNGHNELAWLDLVIGTVDQKSLDSAKRAAEEGGKAAVHTRAMIEIERGLLDEAAESARHLAGNDEEVEPSVWLVTGRMAEALGLNDLARRYYAKVTGEGELAGPTSSEAVAKARVARLPK